MFRLGCLLRSGCWRNWNKKLVWGEWFGPGLYIPPQNESWFVKLTFCCDFQIQTNLCKFLPDRVNKKIYTCRGESRVLLGGSVSAGGNKRRILPTVLTASQPATARTSSSLVCLIFFLSFSLSYGEQWHAGKASDKESSRYRIGVTLLLIAL